MSPHLLLLWFWYVLAFAAGVAVMAGIVLVTVRARTPEEAAGEFVQEVTA